MSWTITPQYRGAAVSDPDAQAYLRAVETADGQPLEPAVALAVNNFVIGCKSDGIWTALKASCILSGARKKEGAFIDLKTATQILTNNGFVDADYNRKTGLVGDGSTKYLNSNRNHNADLQNNRHLAVYTNLSSYSGIFVGARGPNSSFAGASALSHTATNARFRLVPSTDTQQDFGAATLNSVTFIGASRNASNSYLARVSGLSSLLSSPSVSPISGNYFVYTLNDNGTPLSFSSQRLAFYSIGESLDLALLDTRVTTLINAFAAAIP